jgi:hypothetical protein
MTQTTVRVRLVAADSLARAGNIAPELGTTGLMASGCIVHPLTTWEHDPHALNVLPGKGALHGGPAGRAGYFRGGKGRL